MVGREGQQQKSSVGDGLLDPTLKSEILRYADFARICYSVIKNDEIVKESNNLRERGYEITDYIFYNVRLCTSYYRRPIGFIAVCTDENEIRRVGGRDIVVAFRGTSKRREWIQNLKDKVVPWQDLPGPSSKPVLGICKGFLGYYEDKGEYNCDSSPKDIIERTITRLVEKYKGESLSIIICGHSLGGALATMSAYHIKLLRPSTPVTVFTFASPRVGNRPFADHMEEIRVKVVRVVVKGDLVTKVPGLILNENAHNRVARLEGQKFVGQWAYCHVGTKIRLDPSSSPDLSWKARLFHRHNLETYLHLLTRYTTCSS
ncbi:hypothetical protein SUGI_0685970 [Cryptomeria japonica]|uniref:phospholipase A1-Igamma1, chloroplastic-like n=1 Tax=Cryptomeria japonica TaxID=3369 RepID=UPI002414C284|nr:phospholipase A1-Igamma1, chloroplastic-like [Cryptomeria japonica]GLJ34128.1 hypothetical protein SUGI_0685970 [Cryptomeria japonica]